jgi:ATP synthase I chain
MGPSQAEPSNEVVGASTVRRISWLTLAIGLAAALVTEIGSRQWRWTAGLCVGTVLGWLNFRLLRRGAESLIAAAAQTDEKPRMSFGVAVLRYALIGLSVYVIFKYIHLPLVSIVVGLCAFAVATIAASIWAVLNPEE